MTTFAQYLDDLPLLHTWDGETWNTGGFRPMHLRRIHDLVRDRFEQPKIIETGAGNSTITFLQTDPQQVVSIAPAGGLRQRILDYCDAQGVPTDRLEFQVARSEVALPGVALAEPTPRFDVALIDGGHGWPTVFVDFCYMNMMLGAGGVLLLDDTQLHSIAELSRLLEMQAGFTLLDQWGKLQVWGKDTDETFLPEHNRQPYIVAMRSPSSPPGDPASAASWRARLRGLRRGAHLARPGPS